jgi:protein-S-isoprenylcysteine O-methyltransferase Ste14
MIKDSVALIELNIVLIGLLPRIFFKKDGVFNLKWFATAVPFFVSFVALALASLGYLRPTVSGPPEVLATLLAAASIALICFTLGTHRRPLALWHQGNDAPVEIVTWGAYASIRHPFYSSFLLTLLATLVALPHPVTLLVLLYGVIALSMTARREERRLLQSELADSYRGYMATTGRFVPGVGRLRQ